MNMGLKENAAAKLQEAYNEAQECTTATCRHQEFIDLVKRMLLKSPLARLSNITQIKEHVYFNSFSFENLLNFAVTPPYKPKHDVDMEIAIDSDKPELYKEHIKQFKKYTPYKTKQIDPKKQDEYNKWFDNF